MELSTSEKLQRAVDFLKSGPPGEIDDVFNDIRVIIDDDKQLQEEIGPILAECNIQQFYAAEIEHPDSSESSKTVALLTEYNQLDSGSFIDYDAGLSFDFDHLRLEVKNVSVCDTESGQDEFRDQLQAEANKYKDEHFPGGHIKVFPNLGKSETSLEYVICIINNKYNPDNYWNGRYQASWKFNPDTNELNGELSVRIHYYEDGNVQLAISNSFHLEISPSADYSSLPKSIFSLISKEEKQFQLNVNKNYAHLNETTFKDLRRKLPLTKSKIDWLKIASYNLNDELSAVPQI
ncbi:hypothetical protein BB560_003402 [Smittium megazygosporum]|uniref:F-actin-capping protein subunit alpha n=1 Tax=Smittium megazygosporum TaxID=133381 RepID=A0A2T9ZC30_9FUNG|nr:hypothetical protein BB560_003402 [Smittium megazygosporum]